MSASQRTAGRDYLTRIVLVVVRVPCPLLTEVVTRTLPEPVVLAVDFIVIFLVAIGITSFHIVFSLLPCIHIILYMEIKVNTILCI